MSKELQIEANVERLQEVLDFIDGCIEDLGCPPKVGMQIDIAAEEIFVNIASYAYAPVSGTATVRVEVSGEPLVVTLTFMDGGKPFDPTKAQDPNVALSAEEREIGGLGIFMTKKIMDDVSYEYRDGKNILTLKKGLGI